MPKISIITPAYNCEKYLPDAVKSVLSQTFTDWELLIIDDCSKDNTYRYMKKLAEKDKRIRIFQNKVNSGSAATRNYGVRLARGEWIAFLDGDDLWREDKLEKQLAVIERNPEAEFLFTGSAFIEDDGMTIAHVLHVPEHVSRRKLLGQNVISCSSVLIRRELMLEFPMPEEEGIHEDFATWLAILEKVPKAYGVDEPLLIYRKALASKSGKKGKSAQMNWQTYIKAGVPLKQRIFCMASYTFHGLCKYSLLWWRSYRLMMGKERFKKLFLMLMTALLLFLWTWTFSRAWFEQYNFKRIIGRRYYFWGYVAVVLVSGFEYAGRQSIFRFSCDPSAVCRSDSFPCVYSSAGQWRNLFGVGADWTLEIYGAYYAYAGGGSFEFPDWNCVVCSGSVVVRQYLPGT